MSLKSIPGLYKEADLSRRKILKTGAQLAALTVAVGLVPSLLQIKTVEDMVARGLVEDQTFYMDGPLIIDIPDVIIRNCRFEYSRPVEYRVKLGPDAKNCVLVNCIFQGPYADTLS